MIALTFSFFMSVHLIEAEAGLLYSLLSLVRLTRLGQELEDLLTLAIAARDFSCRSPRSRATIEKKGGRTEFSPRNARRPPPQSITAGSR